MHLFINSVHVIDADFPQLMCYVYCFTSSAFKFSWYYMEREQSLYDFPAIIYILKANNVKITE